MLNLTRHNDDTTLSGGGLRLTRRSLAGAAVAALGLVALPTSARAADTESVLRAGETLAAGQSLVSPNRRWTLVMQGDGNLVLYEEGGIARWATYTNGGPDRRAVMQGDGNFVVYNSSDQPLWHTTTAGFGDTAYLSVQDDGNVVIYAQGLPVWARSDGYLGSRLAPGWTMNPGTIRRSPNGQYTFVMQGDGNLVLYAARGKALWAAYTNGPDRRAVMQSDGNFVVYDSANQALWHTKTGGKPGARLEVQDDANLVLYIGSKAIWSRGSGVINDEADRRTGAKDSRNTAERGYCTWGAKEKWREATGYYPRINGNAKDWDESAANNGWTVTARPEARAIFVENSSGFGHCGWVRAVEKRADGWYMHTTEMNTGNWVDQKNGVTTGFNKYADKVRKVTDLHRFILAP